MGARKVQAYLHGMEEAIRAINKWNDHQGGYENLEKHIEALKKGLSGAEAALEEASKAETKMRRAIVDARVEIMNGYPNKATKILQEAL
jgi:hypothetical protein